MQTAISYDARPWDIGQIADEGIRYVRSFIVATDAAAPNGVNMGLGVFALRGVDQTQEARIAEGAASVDDYVFLGVALRDASEPHLYPETYPSSSDYNWTKGKAFPCMQFGRTQVQAEEAVHRGDPVYVRVVASGGETAGHFRASADGTDCILVRGATWAVDTDGAGLAEVSLNFPHNDPGTGGGGGGGGASVPSGTALGDILTWDGSAWSLLPAGTSGQVLAVASGGGLEWVTPA